MMTTQTDPSLVHTEGAKDIVIPRFCVTVEVYDNDTKQMVINEGVSVSRKEGVLAILKGAIHNLEGQNL